MAVLVVVNIVRIRNKFVCKEIRVQRTNQTVTLLSLHHAEKFRKKRTTSSIKNNDIFFSEYEQNGGHIEGNDVM